MIPNGDRGGDPKPEPATAAAASASDSLPPVGRSARPMSVRKSDDALPQTPKFRPNEPKSNSASERESRADQRAARQSQSRRGPRPQYPLDEEEEEEEERDLEELRVCAVQPRSPPAFFPSEFIPNAFVNRHGGPIYPIRAYGLIESVVKPALFHLAKTASRRRFLFTMIPICLVAFALIGPFIYWDRLSIGAPFASFLDGVDPTDYSMQTPETLGQKALFFNGSNPAFDALRRSSQADFGILLSTRNQFYNILSNTSLNGYTRLRTGIRNISVTHSFLSLQWSDICREQCKSENPLVQSLRRGAALLKYPEAVLIDPNDTKKSSRLFFANLLGDLDWDSDGIVTRAHSMFMGVKLKESLRGETYADFEKKLLALVNTRQGDSEIRLYYWSVRNFMREVGETLSEAHWSLLSCVGVLLGFCFIGGIRADSYRTRPFVGLQTGIVLALCAIIGLSVQIAGVGQLNSLSFPVVFVIAATGLFAFNAMAQTWDRYSVAALHPAEKLAFIYSWDGPAFVLGLLVVIMSSVITGIFAQPDYVQVCFFTLAAGLTAVLLFGLFFMTVTWYRSGRREAEGLKWFQCMRRGDQTFNEKCVFDYDAETSAILHDKLTDLKPSFARQVGKFLAQIRMIAAILFTLYVVFAIFGAKQNHIQLGEADFLSVNTTSAQYLQKYRKAFRNYENYLELTFDAQLDYYDQDQRNLLLDLLLEPVREQRATRAVSWLIDFQQFQEKSIYDINSDTIVPVINYVFLNGDHYRKYAPDIIFDKHKTQILKSRSYLELSSKGVEESQELIRSLLQKAHRNHIPLTIKSPLAFSMHHDLEILENISWAAAILIGSICVLTALLFGQLSMMLSVAFSCAAVCIGIYGYAAYLAIPLNVVTLTTILLGVVFTAMTSIQFCYSFINAGLRQQSSASRVQYAFQCSLWPTVSSSLILGVLFFPLPLGVDAPVLMHLWKVLGAVAVLTFLNVLMVLPVTMALLTEQIAAIRSFFDRMVHENGCFGVDQPAESIYFVPTADHRMKMLAAARYGGMITMDGPTRRMIMGAPVAPAGPPDYPHPLARVGYPGAAQRRAVERYRIREASSEGNSRPGSSRMTSQSPRRTAAAAAEIQQTPRRDRRPPAPRPLDDTDSTTNDEQIYEEPESPPLQRGPAAAASPRSNAGTTARIRHYGPRVSDDQQFRVDFPPESPQWRGRPTAINAPGAVPYTVSSPPVTRHRRFL